MRNKMTKRSIAIILSLVLALSGLPVFGSVEAKAAVGDRFNQGDFTYLIINDSEVELHTVKSGVNPADLMGIYIPDYVTDPSDNTEYKVTEIGYGAFDGFSDIRGELRLPQYLKTIETSAFADCTGLYGELNIPESCTIIEDYAFTGDYRFTSLYFGENPNIESIGYWAFNDCYGLSGKFTLPSSVVHIGGNAFRYTGFDTFIIPNFKGFDSETPKINCGKPWNTIINLSTEEYDIDKLIGTDQNNPGYYNYTSSVASTPVTIIGQGEYKAVISQDYIDNNMISDDGFLIDASYGEDGEVWIAGMLDPYKSNLTIPNKVTVDSVEYDVKGICDYAFRDMPISGDLTIENGIEIIGNGAFRNCVALNGELMLPDSLKAIKDDAFFSTGIIGELIFNEGLETIGSSAFGCCSGIKGDIVLPSTLKSYGSYAFEISILEHRPFDQDISISPCRDGVFIIPAEFSAIESELDDETFEEFYPCVVVNYSDIDLATKGLYMNKYYPLYYTRELKEDGTEEYTPATSYGKGVYYRDKQRINMPDHTPMGWLPDWMPCNSTPESLTEWLNKFAAEEGAKGKYTLNDLDQEYVFGNNTISLTYEPYDIIYDKVFDYQWNVESKHVDHIRYENEKPLEFEDMGDYHLITHKADEISFCGYCGIVLGRNDNITETEKEDHYVCTTNEENVIPATSTEEGSYDIVEYCICGKELSRVTKTIPKHSHVAGEAKKENEVAATCTTNGSYDLVTYCSDCGDELSRETKTVEKLGHIAGEAKKENEVAATCSHTGSYDMVTYCDRCGAELSRETKTIEKLNHVAGETKKENEVAATCTVDGSYDLVTYCTECGAELSRETKTVEKLGHIEGTAKKEKEVAATCSHVGSYDMVTYCDRCGAELKRVSYITEKSAHTPGAWETVQHASVYNTGKKVRKCTVCGEVVEEEIIPILTPTPTPDPGNGKTVPGGVVDNPGGGQPIATPTLAPSPTNLPILTPKVTPVPTNKVDPVPTGKPNVSVKERTDGTIIITSTSEGKNGELITSKETVNIDGSVSEVIKVEKPDGSIEKVTKDTKADGGYIETAILKDADGSKVTLTFTSEDGKKASLSEIISSSSEVEIPAEVPGTDGKTHKITALTAGVVSDTAESVVLTDAIKVLKKNALSGLANLTSLKLSDGTKLGKNSLKGTNAKLVLKVVVSKNATKKERKAAKKSMAAQLKKAGNANAKVKIVTE